MKWLLYGMVVVGLWCGMENAAQGQWVDRKKLGEDVSVAYKQGQYERAVALGQQALSWRSARMAHADRPSPLASISLPRATTPWGVMPTLSRSVSALWRSGSRHLQLYWRRWPSV